MTEPDDGNAVDNSEQTEQRTGDLSPTGSMRVRSHCCDLAKDFDEEMEKRFGQKRCRTCG